MSYQSFSQVAEVVPTNPTCHGHGDGEPVNTMLCGSQGLGAPAWCQARASEVGEPSSRHWTTRDLPAPRNINQRELSQRPPSQR